MAAPKFNPLMMDFFSDSGRKNFEKYLKEKELWEKKHKPKKASKPRPKSSIKIRKA